MKTVPMETLHATQTADFVRLFEYVLIVGREFGEQMTWELLEHSVMQRCRKWLELLDQSELEGTVVEQAYELFSLRYLCIPPDQVPIVEKTEHKIVYRSYNFCPVLEACKVLGLDTRKVCKNVYERPTQAFLSLINPNLRFERNYERIRPYAEFCEEVIKLEE